MSNFATQPMRSFSVVIIITLLCFVFTPESSFAQTCTQPSVPLEVGVGATFSASGLTNHIANIFEFIISVIGIISAVMIMFGGLQWTAAMGNSQKITEAKSRVISAVVGLILATVSFVLLSTLNTKLVELPDICPQAIEFQTATAWSQCKTSAASQSTECNGIEYCGYSTEGCSCQQVSGKFVCRPAGTGVIPSGEKCQNDSVCKTGLECVGYSNKEPGVCSTTKEGDACTAGDDSTCDAGTKCIQVDVNTYQCYPESNRENGGYCEKDSECESGTCNESSRKCSLGDGSDGLTCYLRTDCKTNGYQCSGGRCTAFVEGDDCDINNVTDCYDSTNATAITMFCVDTFGVGGTCTDGATVGDPCEEDKAYTCIGSLICESSECANP